MDKGLNLSKRQQIDASTKTVFLWVAGASIVVAFSVIALFFIGQQLFFNEKVLGEKIKTDNSLKDNIETAKTLKDNVGVLLSNKDLTSVKSASDATNLQVVFDALPANYDSANFGASLQGVLLNGTVASIENLSVVSPDDDSISATGTSTATTTTSGPQVMPFTLTITGSAEQVKTALSNMETSIRPIKITGLTIDGGSPLTARISGETYYDPAVKLTLKNKLVKP